MQISKLLLTILLLTVFFGAASSQAFVSANDATTAADCRWCHCQGVPDRHHATKITATTGCISCHPFQMDPATSFFSTQVQRDCTVSGCHGNVVGERHHLAIEKHPELGCYSCHNMLRDTTGSLYASLANTCSLVITPAASNQPPVSDAGGSRTILAGQTVFFNGEKSYDPDGAIVDYTWVFGDGAAATGITAYHQYNNPGTFNAILRVTDNKGATSSNTAIISVSSNPVVMASQALWLKNMANQTVADSVSTTQIITQEFANRANTQLFSISNTSNFDSAIAMKALVEPSTLSSATIRLKVNATTNYRSQKVYVYAYSSNLNNVNRSSVVSKSIDYTGTPTDVDIDITSLLPLMKGMGQIKVRIVAVNQAVIVTSGHFILK